MIPSGCICGRWERCDCSNGKRKWPSPSAWSAAEGWCLRPFLALRSCSKEVIEIGRELRNGTRSIREVVHFDEEELTAEQIAEKSRETFRVIDKIRRLYGVGIKQAARLGQYSEITGPRPFAGAIPIVADSDRDVAAGRGISSPAMHCHHSAKPDGQISRVSGKWQMYLFSALQFQVLFG